MSLAYRLMYLVGFMPWDRDHRPAALRDLVEGPQALAPGRALDIGCGMGRHSIYLAEQGWQVTGVDTIGRALRTARRRAAERGVAVDFRQGDVTRLDRAGIDGPFDLLLDSGCFHGMPDAARRRYGRSITRVAAPAAQLLIAAFGHRALGPVGPRGAERADIERGLGEGWVIAWSAPDETIVRLRPAGPVRATWYRLRRR